MKLINICFLSLVIFFYSCDSTNKENTENNVNTTVVALNIDSLALISFEAFKNNDISKVALASINESDFEEVFSKWEGDEKEKKENLAEAKNQMQEFNNGLSSNFKKIREKAIKDGINWEKAVFKNAEYSIKKKEGIEQADVKVMFSYLGVDYWFGIKRVFNTSRGWVICEEFVWETYAEEKTKELENERKKIISENVYNYLKVDREYTYREIGGIDNLYVSIKNECEFKFENIVVLVEYVRTSGAIYQTKYLNFTNLKGYDEITKKAPDSNLGTSVRVSVVNVESSELGIYPEYGD